MIINATHECSICKYPSEFGAYEAFESHAIIAHMKELIERGEEDTPHNICLCVTDPIAEDMPRFADIT